MTALQTAPLSLPLKRQLDDQEIKPVITSEEPHMKQLKTEVKMDSDQWMDQWLFI